MMWFTSDSVNPDQIPTSVKTAGDDHITVLQTAARSFSGELGSLHMGESIEVSR